MAYHFAGGNARKLARLSFNVRFSKRMRQIAIARFGARLFVVAGLVFVVAANLGRSSIAFIAWFAAAIGIISALISGKCPECGKNFLITPLTARGGVNAWKLILGRGGITCTGCYHLVQ